jgi:hypothetical protein
VLAATATPPAPAARTATAVALRESIFSNADFNISPLHLHSVEQSGEPGAVTGTQAFAAGPLEVHVH